jgi:hypothetical protein
VAESAPSGIRVFDGVVPDVAAYRAAARALPFGDIQTSPGVVFHGMALAAEWALPAWLQATLPGVTPTISLYRQSPAGQIEPNYIHTDRDMGDWTALLYLTPDPPAADGTTFWRRVATGAIASTAADDATQLEEWIAWRDRDQWAPWTTVPAAEGRLVVFPAPYFHSRALEANYGAGDTSRLIQIVFGTGTLPG